MALLSSLSSFQYKHFIVDHVPSGTEWPIPTYTSPYIALSWCHSRTPNSRSFLWEDVYGLITGPLSSPQTSSPVGPSIIQVILGLTPCKQQVDQMSQDWTGNEASPGGGWPWNLRHSVTLFLMEAQLVLHPSPGLPFGPLLFPVAPLSTSTSSPLTGQHSTEAHLQC